MSNIKISWIFGGFIGEKIISKINEYLKVQNITEEIAILEKNLLNI